MLLEIHIENRNELCNEMQVWMPKLLWHRLECMYPLYPEIAGIDLNEEDMEVVFSPAQSVVG